MGSALGSIMAVIMTAQLATNRIPSDSVSGMNMVIIMSGSPRLERTTSTQAAAAMRIRVAEVTRGTRWGAGADRWCTPGVAGSS
jgi:hypothetical protein